MAHKISNGEKSTPAIVSVYDAFRISAEIVTNSWQRHWDNDHTGRYTHNLIPCVGTKVMFPNRRDIGISYCRMLLHDTMLKDDSYRTGTSDTPMCDCCKGNETVEHFLLFCEMYRTARCQMMDYIKTSVLAQYIKEASASLKIYCLHLHVTII